MGNLLNDFINGSENFRDIYLKVIGHKIIEELLDDKSGYETWVDREPEKRCPGGIAVRERDIPLYVISSGDHELFWIHCAGHDPLEELVIKATPYPRFAIAAYKDGFECYKVENLPDFAGRYLLLKGIPYSSPPKIKYNKAERSQSEVDSLEKFMALVEGEKERLETANTA
ncbi:hypothetical protein FQN55_003224 [Onygenales sp. PD_40]|nr:hypothetical protein FQN55_003224 [Onygenales sp. PD_40]